MLLASLNEGDQVCPAAEMMMVMMVMRMRTLLASLDEGDQVIKMTIMGTVVVKKMKTNLCYQTLQTTTATRIQM